MANLGDLGDVNLKTNPPANHDVLAYDSTQAKWIPQSNVIWYEDWLGGEPVNVINTTPPNDISNLTATAIQPTSITLSWTSSISTDVVGYDIYNGSTNIGTTSAATYTIPGLTENTTYTFTVYAKNKTGNTSKGTSISVTTNKKTFALALNGTSDLVVIPAVTFDEVVMDFSAEQKSYAYCAYLDASSSIPKSTFVRDDTNHDVLESAWQSLYIDGVDKTSLLGKAAVVPTNQRTTARVVLKKSGTSVIIIFANQIGQIPMKGKLFGINIFLAGKVVASYDFTTQSTGTSIPDTSGNNRTAIVRGGTWVSN